MFWDTGLVFAIVVVVNSNSNLTISVHPRAHFFVLCLVFCCFSDNFEWKFDESVARSTVANNILFQNFWKLTLVYTHTHTNRVSTIRFIVCFGCCGLWVWTCRLFLVFPCVFTCWNISIIPCVTLYSIIPRFHSFPHFQSSIINNNEIQFLHQVRVQVLLSLCSSTPAFDFTLASFAICFSKLPVALWPCACMCCPASAVTFLSMPLSKR